MDFKKDYFPTAKAPEIAKKKVMQYIYQNQKSLTKRFYFYRVYMPAFVVLFIAIGGIAFFNNEIKNDFRNQKISNDYILQQESDQDYDGFSNGQDLYLQQNDQNERSQVSSYSDQNLLLDYSDQTSEKSQLERSFAKTETQPEMPEDIQISLQQKQQNTFEENYSIKVAGEEYVGNNNQAFDGDVVVGLSSPVIGDTPESIESKIAAIEALIQEILDIIEQEDLF